MQQTQVLTNGMENNNNQNNKIMKTIDELLEPWQQWLFTEEQKGEDLYLCNYDNQSGSVLLVTVNECVECYYGHMLIEPVPIAEFTIPEIQSWREELETFLYGDIKDTPDELLAWWYEN